MTSFTEASRCRWLALRVRFSFHGILLSTQAAAPSPMPSILLAGAQRGEGDGVAAALRT